MCLGWLSSPIDISRWLVCTHIIHSGFAKQGHWYEFKDTPALMASLQLLFVSSFLNVRISQRLGLFPLLFSGCTLSLENHTHLPLQFPRKDARVPTMCLLHQRALLPSSATSKSWLQGHGFRTGHPSGSPRLTYGPMYPFLPQHSQTHLN